MQNVLNKSVNNIVLALPFQFRHAKTPLDKIEAND